MFQAGDNDIANACIRQTVQNEKMFSNPLTVLSLFVPGVGKIVKLFDPSLGLNLEASEVTAKFMLEIMKVNFARQRGSRMSFDQSLQDLSHKLTHFTQLTNLHKAICPGLKLGTKMHV